MTVAQIVTDNRVAFATGSLNCGKTAAADNTMIVNSRTTKNVDSTKLISKSALATMCLVLMLMLMLVLALLADAVAAVCYKLHLMFSKPRHFCLVSLGITLALIRVGMVCLCVYLVLTWDRLVLSYASLFQEILEK